MDLIADIGATNSRCALLDDRGTVVSAETFENASFDGLESVLSTYLENRRASDRRQRAALAVAAPVLGDDVRMLNIGYGNVVASQRVVSVVSPQSAPMKRLREQAEKRGKLLDATQGRRTRSILILDTDHVVLSAVNPETILTRLASGEDTPE